MLKHIINRTSLQCKHSIPFLCPSSSYYANNVSFSTISSNILKNPAPPPTATTSSVVREFEKNPALISLYYNALNKIVLPTNKPKVISTTKNDALKLPMNNILVGDSHLIPIFQAPKRNQRKPKKANHGARPCSRYGRRKRRRAYGNPKRCRG